MKLGIDMGGMSIKMGLVNEENEIIGRITIPTDLTVPYQMLVERMADSGATLFFYQFTRQITTDA